jgi:hypothetical protein
LNIRYSHTAYSLTVGIQIYGYTAGGPLMPGLAPVVFPYFNDIIIAVKPGRINNETVSFEYYSRIGGA